MIHAKCSEQCLVGARCHLGGIVRVVVVLVVGHGAGKGKYFTLPR